MMPAWLAIARKDLRVLSRDPMATFWALGFPVLFALFFGSIMRVGDDAERMKIAVVLVQTANRAQLDSVAAALAGAGLGVSRAPRAAARDAVRRGQAALFIELPPPGAPGAVQIGADPTRGAEADMAEGVLRGVLLRALAPAPIALPPIERVAVIGGARGPRSGFEAVFPAMILWGLLGCTAAFAVALVSERSSGTLLRLYAAPCSRGAIVLGKALACAIACVLGTAALSLLGVLALGVRVADPFKLVAAVLATAACFVGLTQLLGALGKSEQSVAGAGWSVLIVLAMAGGAMVPELLMPAWLRAIGAFSPVRWGIAALEGATFRAFDWSALLPQLALLCAGGTLSFALAALLLRVREN
jgi:ABC-2 type transport system permease protein